MPGFLKCLLQQPLHIAINHKMLSKLRGMCDSWYPDTDDTGNANTGGVAPGSPRKCPLALRQGAFCSLCCITIWCLSVFYKLGAYWHKWHSGASVHFTLQVLNLRIWLWDETGVRAGSPLPHLQYSRPVKFSSKWPLNRSKHLQLVPCNTSCVVDYKGTVERYYLYPCVLFCMQGCK